jgi:hypothetical protein
MTETLEQARTAYDASLNRQPLAAKTRTAYRLQVRKSGAYLAQRLQWEMIRCIRLLLATMRFETTQAIYRLDARPNPPRSTLHWQLLTTSTCFWGTIDRRFGVKPCQRKLLARSNRKSKKPWCERLLRCFFTQPSALEYVRRSIWMTCASPHLMEYSSSAQARVIPTAKCRSMQRCARHSGSGSRSGTNSSRKPRSRHSFSTHQGNDSLPARLL